MLAILLNICLKTIYLKKRSLRPLRNKSPLQLLRVFQMCYWGLCSYIIHSLNSNRFDQNMAKKTIFPLLLKVFGEWYKYILNSSCISIWLLHQHNLFNCKNAEIHITRQINKFLIKRGLFNVIWATQTSMRHTYIWLFPWSKTFQPWTLPTTLLKGRSFTSPYWEYLYLRCVEEHTERGTDIPHLTERAQGFSY